jgi:hypothetical protein
VNHSAIPTVFRFDRSSGSSDIIGPEPLNHGWVLRRPVRLTEAEEVEIWNLYINDGLLPDAPPISGNLASYITLLYVCGPAALGSDPPPPVEVDSWTVWRAASPALRNVLKREGEAIICPKLGKRYPMAA